MGPGKDHYFKVGVLKNLEVFIKKRSGVAKTAHKKRLSLATMIAKEVQKETGMLNSENKKKKNFRLAWGASKNNYLSFYQNRRGSNTIWKRTKEDRLLLKLVIKTQESYMLSHMKESSFILGIWNYFHIMVKKSSI